MARIGFAAAATAWVCLTIFLVQLFLNHAYARDVGQFAASTPEMREWFNGLRADHGRGTPCCSDADGTAISDVDWKTKDGHYQVRLDGEWVDVPDEALIEQPNRVGHAMVWPYFKNGRPIPRCFMPGSMT